MLLYDVVRAINKQKLKELPSYETDAEYSQHELELVEQENARAAAEELTLIEAAVAADPDNAWSHYWRAFHLFDRDEMELGLADLETGNAAPDATFHFYCPFG